MTDLKLPKQLKAILMPPINNEDRFKIAPNLMPQTSYQIMDPDNNSIWGYIVIDNTTRGPGLGGIRIVPDLNLNEISRLAKIMTMKNSAACLPYGGAKAGIILKSPELTDNPKIRNDLIDLFAECLFDLGSYVPAPDMGSNEMDIQIIHDNHSRKLKTDKHSRGGVGRPVVNEGIPIDDWELTAHGLFTSIKTIEAIDDTLDLSKSKFVVQGFGNVGAPTAMKLQQLGATLVGASDINTALWNPNGLDVQELNHIRKQHGGLKNYTHDVHKIFSAKKLDWLLEAPCDILIPSARPDAITGKNVDRIQCRYILQGANTPSSKSIEYYLHHRRKILSLTDFIVNAGGVIGCAVERNMYVDHSYKQRVKNMGIRNYVEKLIAKTISKNVSDIYERMNNKSDAIFRDLAWELALERLNSHEVWQ